MTSDQRKEQIKEIVKKIYLKGKTDNTEVIDDNQSLTTDLGFDSVEVLGLVVAVEKTFQVQIPDELLLVEYFDSVNAIETLLNKLS